MLSKMEKSHRLLSVLPLALLTFLGAFAYHWVNAPTLTAIAVEREDIPIVGCVPQIEVHTLTMEEQAAELFYDDLELLAYCVMSEAGNQPEEGKRLVIDTILNRVESPYFPDTIKEVIYAPGQFEVVAIGTLYKWEPTEDIYTLIREEVNERLNDKVVYFTAGYFNPSGEPWQQVGDHYFSYIRKELQ